MSDPASLVPLAIALPLAGAVLSPILSRLWGGSP